MDEVKPYWQKTQREIVSDYRRTYKRSPGLDAQSGMFRAHYKMVKQALEEGKPVPAEVLRDYPLEHYPDLAKLVAKPPAVGGNPVRVRFDRASIDSAIAAAKRLESEKDLYIFATYLGYTIDRRPPPGMQQYVVVHPDGSTETVKPLEEGNPMMETVNPAKEEQFVTKVAKYLVEQRKPEITAKELEAIARELEYKDIASLINYIQSTEGRGNFKKVVRLELVKAGYQPEE